MPQVQVLVTVDYTGDELNQTEAQSVADEAASAAAAKVGELGRDVLSSSGVLEGGRTEE